MRPGGLTDVKNVRTKRKEGLALFLFGSDFVVRNLFDNCPLDLALVAERGQQVGDTLIRQIRKTFDTCRDLLNGLRSVRVGEESKDRIFQPFIFKLGLGGLAGGGCLAGKQFNLVVQPLDQFCLVLDRGGLDHSDSVLEEFGLSHGVLTFSV